MLKQAVKDKLKTFGLDVDKLIEAVTATAETDYAVPEDITVIKTVDLEARDTNNKNAGKTEGESVGEKKGKELAAKAFKRKFNLEDTIPADVDKVVEAVNVKLNKGDAGLQEQITLLQRDKESLLTEKQQLEQKAAAAAFDAELISHFPSTRTADLTDAERLALVKMNLGFETVDGKQVVKRNGEVVRDKATQNPLAVKDVIGTLFTEKKWVAADGGAGAGGRGGGDNTGGGSGAGIKKLSGYKEKWKAENPGIDENGPAFQDAIGKHAKDIPDFDWYN
jgi:hypothetical protein